MKRNGGIVCVNTPCVPASDYGASKLEGEEAFRTLESDSFRVTYLRIPSVYYEGNTLFMNVAKEMYHKFPKFYPRLGEKLGRGTMYAGSVCKCVELIIRRQQYGIVCPQDEPVYSLFDYMALINEKNGNAKRPSRALGLAVRLIMLVKPEWKQVFGQIRYSDELASVLDGQYSVQDQKMTLLSCLDDQ